MQAVDQYGNGVGGEVVHLFTSLGTVNGTTSLTTNSAGDVVFSGLSITKTGSYSLTASATGLTSVSTNTFTITPSLTTARITFVNQPASSAPGTLSPVTVQVLDQYGNAVSGIPITMRLSSGAERSRHRATGTTGRVVFTQLTDTAAGTNLTLIASGEGLPSVSSSPFTIT